MNLIYLEVGDELIMCQRSDMSFVGREPNNAKTFKFRDYTFKQMIGRSFYDLTDEEETYFLENTKAVKGTFRE